MPSTVAKIWYGAPDNTGPCPQLLYLYDSSGNLIWRGEGVSITPADYAGGWNPTFSKVTGADSDGKNPTDTSTSSVSGTVSAATDQGTRVLTITYGGTRYFILLSVDGGTDNFTAYERPFGQGRVVVYMPASMIGSYAAQLTYSSSTARSANSGSNPIEGETEVSESYNEIPVKSYLDLERAPMKNTHAATKAYVDSVSTTLSTHAGSTSIHVPAQNTAGYVFLSDTTATSPGTWSAIVTSPSSSTTNAQLIGGKWIYDEIAALSAFKDKSLATSVASGNGNPVTSGAVYTEINKLSAFASKTLATSSTTISSSSTDAQVPTAKLVYQAIDALSSVYAADGHTHSGADITSGTIDKDRLPAASSSAKGAVTLTVYNSEGVATDSDSAAITPKAAKKVVDDAIASAAGSYAASGHKHAAGDIDSGTLAAARLPNATTSAKGGVIVGAGLSVSSGTVSVDYATCKTGLGLGSAAYKATGTGNGNIPVLDSNGKLDDSVIPSLAITDTFEANSQNAMLALSNAKKGDVCIRTDQNKCYILSADGYSTLANWKELKTPTDAVQSVNGKTGAVSLLVDDLYAVSGTKITLEALSVGDTYKLWTGNKIAAAINAVTGSNISIGSDQINDLMESTAILIGGETLSFGEVGVAVSDIAVAEYVTSVVNGLDLANTYAAKSHNHNASAINAGTLDKARLPDADASNKGAVVLAKAVSSGTTDTTNDTKAVTPKAAKQIADAAAASATAAAAKGKIYTFTGDGSTTDFTCTHGLGLSNVLVQVFNSSGQQVWVAVSKTSAAVTIKFAAAPAAADGQYTAVILGVAEAS